MRWWPATPALCFLLLSITVCFSSCAHKQRQASVITPRIGTKEKGVASWYGEPYHGRATASGEIFDMHRHDTAAHRRFAFGTWVRVENLDNGQRTEVRINDRGPFVRGRILDLARGAANDVGMIGPGTARVRLTVIAAPAAGIPRSTRSSSTASEGAASEGRAGAPSVARAEQPDMWAVQIAASRDESAARAAAQRVSCVTDASPCRVAVTAPPPNGSDPWWRVLLLPSAGRIGGESPGSEEDVRRLLAHIRMEFPEAFITRRRLKP